MLRFTVYHLDGNTAQFRMMADDDASCLLHCCSAHMLQSICCIGVPTCRADLGLIDRVCPSESCSTGCVWPRTIYAPTAWADPLALSTRHAASLAGDQVDDLDGPFAFMRKWYMIGGGVEIEVA